LFEVCRKTPATQDTESRVIWLNQAQSSSDEAIRLCRQAGERGSDKAPYHREQLIQLLFCRANILEDKTRFDANAAKTLNAEIAQCYKEVIPLAREALALDPGRSFKGEWLAISLDNYARMLIERQNALFDWSNRALVADQRAEALAMLEKALEVESWVSDAMPDNPWVRNRTAHICDRAGQLVIEILQDSNSAAGSESGRVHLAKADALFDLSIEHRRRIARDFSKHAHDFRSDLISVLCNHAMRLRERCRRPMETDNPQVVANWEARSRLLVDEALNLCRQSVADHPDNVGFRQLLDGLLKLREPNGDHEETKP
jgi:hypothetical protein